MVTAAPESTFPVTTHAQQAVDEAIGQKTDLQNWQAFIDLVRQEYAYCTMYGVHIAAGHIVSCESIQRSLLFANPQPRPQEPCLAPVDERWQALAALCAQIGTGKLAELKFSEAKPTGARTAEGGRRFRHFHRHR